MNSPEELEAAAKALEEEAISLEQQKLTIAAQAKLQQAKTLRDQATLLRQEHAGRQKLQGESIELPPDDPRKRFWRNLTDANIEDSPGGFQVLRLQPGTYFLDPERKISSILLRPCYKDLWNLVIEGSGKFIITGTPGVGKTLWQYYAMYNLAKLGVTVVVDFKGMTKCLCFSKDSVREGPLTAFYEDLLQDDTWYLVDTREPEKAAAKTILTTSPRRDVYKEFAKGGASTLYMPFWSRSELDAGRHLHGLEKDEILALYEKWGGSARYVLHLARNASRQRDLGSAIAKANLDAIYKAVGEIDSADEVSHRLLHINVAPNYLDTDMMFASEFIGRKVGEKFCKGTTLPLQAFITATAGMKEYNDVRGKMFEPLAHRIVGGGGSFDVWDLEMGTGITLNLAPCTSFYTFHDLTEVADQEAGTYCIPSRSDQAAIDSIQQPNYLFQMTVADKHSINATGLSNALKQLRKGPKTDAELFFAVPPDQYPGWRKKQEYTGQSDLKVLRTVKQRVIKVPLKMRAHSLRYFRAV